MGIGDKLIRIVALHRGFTVINLSQRSFNALLEIFVKCLTVAK
jgi:hypothetical protein